METTAYANMLLSRQRDFYVQKCFTDVTVVCGTECFELHACVIASGSDFFRAALTTGMIERTARRVELHDVLPSVFRCIVDSLYTGVLAPIDAECVMGLLDASKRLQVAHAEAQCYAWLSLHLDEASALIVWEGACKLDGAALRERSLSAIARHLAKISTSEAFLQLSAASLLELVSSDHLAARSEIVVFEAVKSWLRADTASRQPMVGAMLRAVRLCLLPAEYLSNAIEDPLFRHCSDARQLLRYALEYCAKHPLPLPLVRQGATTASIEPMARRRMLSAAFSLVVVGGWDGLSAQRSVEEFDLTTHEWRPLPPMHSARFGCGVACVEGVVYAVGGSNGPQCLLKSAESYHAVTRRWTPLPDINGVPTAGCGLAALHGVIYAIGGHSGSSALRSARCYDILAGKWRALPPLRVARSRCAVVCSRSKIYAIGGESDRSILKSVEVFDPATQSWSDLPDMSVARAETCAAVDLDGLVYVVGGFDGEAELNCAEYFTAETSQWQLLPPMRTPRSGCAVVCVEGALVVFGGTSDGLDCLKSVEYYALATRQWHELPEMSVARRGCGSAALRID